MADELIIHKDVSIAPYRGLARVHFRGQELIASHDALVLHEGSAPALIYFPIKDVPTGLLQASDHTSFCPKKGRASYWDVMCSDLVLENAVWGYPLPLSQVAILADYVSFYPNLVEIDAPGI